MSNAFRLSPFVLAGLLAAGLAVAGTPAQALSTEPSDPAVLRLDPIVQAQAPTTQAPAQTPVAAPSEPPAAAGTPPVAQPAVASRPAAVAKPKPIARAAGFRSVRATPYRAPASAYLVASRFERAVVPLFLGVGY
ncbi:MAG: hypothetical protein HXX10_23005 [Rhodoplanes sp.]|uniref:hypothetical protein n=1 Tax=Rhodoplanes sp. TaxID=1968906 RepID=UPI0017A2079C|nr:hypothetical protein [Rhodoplanes sp.]NVO16905.1 hypothetical protein [Rhodoplanes sp.]